MFHECQNHRRKTLMMWLQNCMKWDISWSINISLRCAPLAQHFSHFSCLVIALFLIFSCEKSSKRENEKYVDDAPFPLLLCTCKLVSYASESNSVFTEFKMKKFFLLFGIAREERVANNKKMLNRFQYEYAYWSGSDFNKLHRWQNHTQFMNFIIFFWLL